MSAQLREAAFKEPQKRSRQSLLLERIERAEEAEDEVRKRSNKRVLKVFSDVEDRDDDGVADDDDQDLGPLNVDGDDDVMIEMIEEED